MAATLPAHRWQALSCIVVGVIGTIGHARIGMPTPGERHSYTVLAGALALCHNLWILPSWLLIGPPSAALPSAHCCGRRTTNREPPLWLGFAIGGIVCFAAEVALRRYLAPRRRRCGRPIAHFAPSHP